MTKAIPWAFTAMATDVQGNATPQDSQRIQVTLYLNAYSFNNLLRDGRMSLEQLLRFAKDTDFHGVDLTAYYRTGYPDVPDDEVLYNIKRTAFAWE